MTDTRRSEPTSRAARTQDALNRIGSWLLDVVKAEPGWSEMILDVKPLAGQVYIRVREFRDGEEYIGSVGPLKEDSPVLPDLRKLQRAAYDGNRGTWFTASVVVAANNWPEPKFSVGASYNRDEEPENWGTEGTLSASDVREHLHMFPRDSERIPAWATERMHGRARDVSGLHKETDYEIPNPYLAAALEAFKKDVKERTLINVVRTMLGGDLLVDASGSTIVPAGHLDIGPESQLRYQVIRLENGMQALCVFSSAEYVSKSYMRENSDDDELILREPAVKIFMDFLSNPDLDLIAIDPGSNHECYIERAQVQWVVNSPRNDGAKMALINDNMQQLLGSLVAPNSILVVAIDPKSEVQGPAFVPDDDGNPTNMLAFTSPIEVAAIDPAIEVRVAHAIEVLTLAEQLNAPGIQINYFNPSAVLDIKQIRELLDIVREQEAVFGASPAGASASV